MYAMRRAVLALSFLLLFIGTASAVPWTITDSFYTPTTVSNNSEVVTIMQVTYTQGGTTYYPGPEECSSLNIQYNYNTTENQPMAYIPESQGYFYANLSVRSSDTVIDLFAEGTCDGVSADDTATDSVTFDPDRNLSVRVLNRTHHRTFLEGSTYTMRVNVTNQTGFEPDDRIDVDWNLMNWTEHSVASGSLSEQDGYYSTDITIPDPSERFYYLNITAENTTAVGYQNATGGTARVLSVERQLAGNISLNNTAGECNDAVTRCEKSAVLNTTFNATRATADNVTAWVHGNGNNLTTFNYSWDDSTELWEQNFTIPADLNTTTYGDELTVTAHAKNSLSATTATRDLNVSSFRLIEETASYVFQGNEIDLVFGPVAEFTGIPIERALIDSFNVSVDYPNGTELMNDSIGMNDSISDTNYLQQQRLLRYGAQIPSGSPTGTYNFRADVTDIFGDTRNDTFTFNVYSSGDEESDVNVIDISSAINDLDSTEEIEKQFEETGDKSGSIVLRNDGTESGTVRVHLSESLGGLTTYDVSYLSGPPIDLEPDSAAELEFNFSLSEEKQYTGEITFMVEGSVIQYNRTLPVNFTVGEQLDCAHENGSLCVEDEDAIQKMTTSESTISLRVSNGDNATNISYGFEGNLSDILTDGDQEFEENEVTDLEIPVSVSADDNGFYTGNITVSNDRNEMVRVPAEINVSIAAGEINVTAPSPDLGTHMPGDTVTFDLDITNTGGTDLSNITVTSSDLGLTHEVRTDDGDWITLGPDEETTTTVELDTSGLGGTDRGENNPVTLNVISGSGVESTVEVRIVVREDLNDDIASYQDQISTFRDQVETIRQNQGGTDVSNIQSQITDMEAAVTNAEEALAAGNYDEATSQLNTASDLESQIQTSIENAQATGGGQNGGQNNDTQTGDPGDGQDPSTGNGGGGGGLPILFIVIVVILLAVVGVILYLSLVPEESEKTGQFGSPPPR
jgi:hypothetical protein